MLNSNQKSLSPRQRRRRQANAKYKRGEQAEEDVEIDDLEAN